MKKRTATAPTVSPLGRSVHRWHNGADVEIDLYARSLQKAAKLLVTNLDRKENPRTAWDTGPVILLYQRAVELRLREVVHAGRSFLPSPTDPLTLAKTHSLRWLAQIVCQIIRAVKWESEFQCEGTRNLADFSTMIADLEEMEPVSAAIHGNTAKKTLGQIPPKLSKNRILEIVPKLEALIDLLVSTADGLAATADSMFGMEQGREHTIQ